VKKKKMIDSQNSLFVRKNDTVVILSGEDKHKQGKVLKVFPKEERIIVEGVNFVKRHSRPTQKNPKGGIVEKEGVINASNVMVVCSKCREQTRVGSKILNDGSRIRVCKKCGEMIEVVS
jgi:large subunit ribosomal protein L24